MHEPTAEWLLVVFCSASLLSLSFLKVFFFLPLLPQQYSSSHFSLWARTAQTILSFSLSCLSCSLSPHELLGSDACQVATAALRNGSCGWRAGQEGGIRRRFGPGMLRGDGTWRSVERRRRGRRPDASDADGERRRGGDAGGGGVWVDPSKSLGSFSRLKLLPACEEQGLCLGVSHPGECLASG